jgi:hypothetical protein
MIASERQIKVVVTSLFEECGTVVIAVVLKLDPLRSKAHTMAQSNRLKIRKRW